jgi:sulfur-carrier protein
VLPVVVTLEFLGSLRHASDQDTLSLSCKEGLTVLRIIDQITKGKPELRKSLLDEHLEDPKPNALILINGREISVLNNLLTQINDGDRIVFVPVVHGG